MAARTAKPAPPRPWRREDGRYRSDDDRFTIESGGAGRWFLTDEGSLDELGLARTLGPYDTLDGAKDAAVAQRGQAAAESPLADRLAAAKERPARAGSAPRTSPPGPKRAAMAHTASDDEPDAAPEPDPAPEPEPEPEPPSRTWLDDLEDGDRAAATRAKRAIAAMERLGIADADAIVRRDVLGRQPAVAARLLGHSLAAALRDRLEPAALARDARAALPAPMRALRDVDEEALAAYAAFIAARVLEATLEVVAADDRADGAGKDLPGWRLDERPAAGVDGVPRRLIVTPTDVG